ncbi:MAG: hypothetical protein R6V72_06930, partial [Cyclobacterium sp.]|uniref:hypothetical protein n=1 Tax=Cyclobacterium sp. TaxID=1966343 RepID=UPI003970AC6A
YKFIRYDDSDLIELYHHKTDFNEVNNLALDARYTEKVAYYSDKCDSVIHELLKQRVTNQ